MGNYKSRPSTSCADELKKKISEGYSVLRSRILDDLKSREDLLTPLQLSCLNFVSIDEVKKLLTKETAKECTENNLNLIHIVSIGNAAGNKTELVQLLVANDVSILATSRNGFAAIHFAAYRGDNSLIETLIACGADVNQIGHSSMPPIHLACMCGHHEAAEKLLNSGANVAAQDWVKFSPMHVGCYFGHDKVTKVLMEHGADVNQCGGVKDMPLHLASTKGFIHIAQQLLKAGADAKAKDEEGNNVLHFCCKGGHASLLEILLDSKNGINPHEGNIYGDTPLHLACYAGKLEIVRQLIQRTGIESLTKENIFSEMPLHSACTSGKTVELVALLLKQPGVNVNCQGQDGHTALHSACYHGHLKLVQFLLEHGADPSLPAKALLGTESSGGGSIGSIASSSNNSLSYCEEQTPIMWAYEKGHDAIVAILKQYKRRDNDSVCSEYSSGDSSYVPLPSPLGKIRSITKEKAGILQLRSSLPSQFQLSLADIDFQEAVGSGSFGRVYRGTCNGKTVAIKRYRAAAFGTKSDVDMFCREVSILCQLNSAYVINFVGACLDDPSQFAIITEYLSGGSLFSLLHEQKRPLDQATKRSIILDVARGMDYLHHLPQPVIHRDLNSHNILLHDDGRAVVADFGGTDSGIHVTFGSSLQNLRWMAPEIFKQCTRYSVKADVFSYALVVWEIYAGDLPFAHLKPAAAAAEMAYKGSRPSLLGSFPPFIVELCQHCWQTSSDIRPDFADVIKVLESVSVENGSADGAGGVASSCCNHLPTMGHVSAMKSHWESQMTSQKKVSPFDELRKRLDKNGYISEAALNSCFNVQQ